MRFEIYDLLCHFFEGDRVMSLLDGEDGITLILKCSDGVEGVFVILPFDGFFGSEGGLMNLLIRGAATDAAEDDALDTHGVGGTEDRSDIMLAADVVKHHHQR